MGSNRLVTAVYNEPLRNKWGLFLIEKAIFTKTFLLIGRTTSFS